MTLSQYLTPKQTQKLKQQNIDSLYKLITYLPDSLTKILPIENITKTKENQNTEFAKTKFLLQAKIKSASIKQKTKKFIEITTDNPRASKIYYFSWNPKIISQFKTGLEFQFLLEKNGVFWNISKFSLVRQTFNTEIFVLGSSPIQEYLLPKYPKLGNLQSGYFNLLHRRLPDQAYTLNLTNLIPPNLLQSNFLNLKALHKPKNSIEFQKSYQDWQIFQAFLILVKHKYYKSQKTKSYLPKPLLDLKYLQNFSQNLEFELSKSQKLTIWSILNQITLAKAPNNKQLTS